MSILIKNGRIINASDDYVADIFIEGETVSAIGKNLKVNPDKGDCDSNICKTMFNNVNSRFGLNYKNIICK